MGDGGVGDIGAVVHFGSIFDAFAVADTSDMVVAGDVVVVVVVVAVAAAVVELVFDVFGSGSGNGSGSASGTSGNSSRGVVVERDPLRAAASARTPLAWLWYGSEVWSFLSICPLKSVRPSSQSV